MTPTLWLLLVITLPGQNPTLRMRIWRAMRQAGAAALRDGVYLLPQRAATRAAFEAPAAEINGAGGNAQLLAFAAATPEQEAEFVALFDRTEAYARLIAQAQRDLRDLPKLDEPEARRRHAALGRDRDAVAATDYYAGAAQRQADEALATLAQRIERKFSPEEPHAATGRLRLRDRGDYRGRTWATRRKLWVDRVCCAWLIRRRIDPKAKFLWLERAKDCPKQAVGFDFDSAEFSHVGAKVTFEVLLASFGLDADAALMQLGALVRYLDAGGVAVPEAPGFERILAGLRALHADDDDALLRAALPVLDALYAAFAQAPDDDA